MNNELLELKYWLTGYLHQDFDAEFRSVDNALNVYKTEESPEKVDKLKCDLAELILSNPDESVLRDLLLTTFDCCYYYPSEWNSGIDWLRHLQEILNR
jgi:hypothetical protein